MNTKKIPNIVYHPVYDKLVETDAKPGFYVGSTSFLIVPKDELPDNFDKYTREYQIKEVLSTAVYLGFIKHWNESGPTLDDSCLPDK